MIYGDPIKYTITLLEKEILNRGEDELKFTEVQKRIIEEVCFDQFTLKILWNDDEGKPQEESFVFKDHQNPMCENVDRIAPKDDVN